MKRRRRLWRLGLTAVFIGLLLVPLGYFGLASQFLIQKVAVKGSNNPAILTDFVSSKLAGAYFNFLPKRHFLLYPRETLKRQIMTAFPQLASVGLAVERNTLVVSASERQSVALVCRSGAASECYFLDQSGLIFAPAPRFSGQILFVWWQEGAKMKVGERPFGEEWTRLNNLREQLNSLFPVTEARALGEGDYRFAAKFAVLINSQLAVDLTLVNLRSALATPELKKIIAERPETLDYIDLRFPPKVFYKLKN